MVWYGLVWYGGGHGVQCLGLLLRTGLSWTIIDYHGQRYLFIERLDYNDQLQTDGRTLLDVKSLSRLKTRWL